MGGSIRMTFGRIGEKFECLMTSEQVNQIKPPESWVKKVKTDSKISSNPMVVVKKEALEEVIVKKEKHLDEPFVNIDDLLEDSEEDDIKPNIQPKMKPGIRVIIDRNQNCTLTSEVVHNNTTKLLNSEKMPVISHVMSLNSEDQKPDIAELRKAVKPGIRLTINKNKNCVDLFSEVQPYDMEQGVLADFRKQENFVGGRTGYKYPAQSDIPPLPDDLEMVLAEEDDHDDANSDEKTKDHECVNSGCSKKGSHICVFPPYRKLSGSRLKTKGFININIKKSLRHKKPSKTVFNKSFSPLLGCIFYFKSFPHSHIEVTTRDPHHHYLMFKITLYQNKTSSTSTLGRLNQSRGLVLPTTMFTGGIIKYKIVIFDAPTD